MSTDNNFLGEFTVSNIKRAPKRTNPIYVTFSVNANSVLEVSAHEGGTAQGGGAACTITTD